MKGRILRVVCAMLAFVLTLCAQCAMADDDKVAYVCAVQLPIYAAPEKGAKQLDTVAYGESLNVYEVRGEVAQVRSSSGSVGYCAYSGLTATDPNQLELDAYVRSGGATIYMRPDTTCDSSVQANAGAVLQVVALTPDGKWARVQRGERFGYVLMDRLSDERSDLSVWIVYDDAVAVFDGQNGDDVGVCSYGQCFELLELSGGMAHIRNSDGFDGWVIDDVISKTDPNTLDEVAYAQIGGRIVWRNSLLRGDSAQVAKGAKLNVVAVTPNGTWARVHSGENYGYVLSVLIDTDQPSDTAPELVCMLDKYDIYDKVGNSSKIVATVLRDECVRLLGVSTNGRALKVQTKGGITGYVSVGGWVKK